MLWESGDRASRPCLIRCSTTELTQYRVLRTGFEPVPPFCQDNRPSPSARYFVKELPLEHYHNYSHLSSGHVTEVGLFLHLSDLSRLVGRSALLSPVTH